MLMYEVYYSINNIVRLLILNINSSISFNPSYIHMSPCGCVQFKLGTLILADLSTFAFVARPQLIVAARPYQINPAVSY